MDKYICIINKEDLDNAPTSPILKQSEMSSYYTNGQTYVHVRQDRFSELESNYLFKENLELKEKLDLAKVAIFNAVQPVLKACGNSYSNAWCQHFLTIAKILDCYSGETTGNIYGEDGIFDIEEEKRWSSNYSELKRLDEKSFDKLILQNINTLEAKQNEQ